MHLTRSRADHFVWKPCPDHYQIAWTFILHYRIYIISLLVQFGYIGFRWKIHVTPFTLFAIHRKILLCNVLCVKTIYL